MGYGGQDAMVIIRFLDKMVSNFKNQTSFI
jgi:hypothetical protein